MALYTPFLADVASNAIEKAREREVGRAVEGAMMGDPGAMAELQQLDPNMAMKVESHQTQQEEIGLNRGARNRQEQRLIEDREREEADRQRTQGLENRELMQELAAEIGAFDDFETARGYANDQYAQLSQITGQELPPLTEENYNQFKQLRDVVAGDDWERSGGPQLEQGPNGPMRVQTFVNPKTRETVTVPVSLSRAITGHDAELRGQIKQSETRAKTEEERQQERIEAGLNSIVMMPDLQRAKELLKTVTTGGLQTDIDNIRRYFGDQSLEVADMGELQVLLANDLIEKFSLMTGVLSESDMLLLRSISAGSRAPSTVNQRLMENVIRKAERKINLGAEAAKATGSAFDIQQFDNYLSGGKGEPGSSQDNPLVAKPGPKPPAGTWVRLPNGTVTQVE